MPRESVLTPNLIVIGCSLLATAPRLGEDPGSDQHCFADDWHADIAREMDEDFGELVFGPALLQGKAQMDVELGMTAGGSIRDDADERARLDIEPGPRPERTEHGLGGDVDELFHHWVFGVFARIAREILLSAQPPADCHALLVKLALGHGPLLGAWWLGRYRTRVPIVTRRSLLRPARELHTGISADGCAPFFKTAQARARGPARARLVSCHKPGARTC